MTQAEFKSALRKRPVREEGEFLYDHPANAIGGGGRGDTPGSTFGQEFFLGRRLNADPQWRESPVYLK